MELSVIFLGFLIVSVNASPGKDTQQNGVCDVTVKNPATNFSRATMLECDLTLSEVRKKLEKKSWIDSDNYFLNKKSVFLEKELEGIIKLKTVLVDEVLSIGHPNDKGGNFLTKFLKGFTFANDGSIESTTHTLCSFDEGYAPSEDDPQTYHEYETSLAFSSKSVKRQSSGIDAVSLSLSSPWVDAAAEYRNEREKSSGKSTVTTYLTTRSVYNKKNVDIDPTELRIDDDFEEKLNLAIVRNRMEGAPKKYSVKQCKQLIRVLNQYGWYIVTKYTLGGGFYVTDVKEASSYEDAEDQKHKVEVSAGGKFGGFGASAKYEHGSTEGTSSTSSSKSEGMTFNQIGGGNSAHLSPEKFETGLADQNNWRMIRLDNFTPSLLLLKRFNKQLFDKCVRVLRKFGMTANAQILQPDINIVDYANSLSQYQM